MPLIIFKVFYSKFKSGKTWSFLWICHKVVYYLLQLGSIEKVQSPTSDVDTREMLIKNHFSTRINELTLQLQTSDSKTVSFHAEVSLKPFMPYGISYPC